MNIDLKEHEIVKNAEVYGLIPSIVASKYPMLSSEPSVDMQFIVDNDIKRASRLGNAPQGSGHDCYLKGIIVQFDLSFTRQAWLEAARYHFLDFVASMSTMHSLTKMQQVYFKYVDSGVIKAFNDVLAAYQLDPTEDNWRHVIYSYPVGLVLTARMTTNYLQLKTIYAQRRTHRLPEWQLFCDWIETLPKVKELGVVTDV